MVQTQYCLTLRPPLARALQRGAAALALLALAACASTRIDAQWRDPELRGTPLKGARVLVVCQAAEVSVRRLCEEHFARALNSSGALAQFAGELPEGSATGLALARQRGAAALWQVRVSADASQLGASPSLSFGFGGFGGGNVGAGVGISLPVGGAPAPQTAYAAEVVLQDSISAQLMWSAKAVTPAGTQLNAQLLELAQTLANSAQQAGLW